MAALKLVKKELRQQIKRVLSGLSQDEIARQTSVVLKNLLLFPEYKQAKRISIFLSMPEGEVSTTAIVHDALRLGKKVFVPYTHGVASKQEGQPSSIMDMVELKSLDDFESLEPDKWGIPTPSHESISSRENSFGGAGVSETLDASSGIDKSDQGLDLIVVPGMAFDVGFGRLGHGKGYYDYFLTRSAQQSGQIDGPKMPFLVGIALKEQVLPENESVPMHDTDWRLDALVVGDGRNIRASGL